jgi:hypothetical protein
VRRGGVRLRRGLYQLDSGCVSGRRAARHGVGAGQRHRQS